MTPKAKSRKWERHIEVYGEFRILPMAGEAGITARIRRLDGGAFSYNGSLHGAISTKPRPDILAAVTTAKNMIDALNGQALLR